MSDVKRQEWVRCPAEGNDHPVVYLKNPSRCPYCGKKFENENKEQPNNKPS